MKKKFVRIAFFIIVSFFILGLKFELGLKEQLHIDLKNNTPYTLKWVLKPGNLQHEYNIAPPLFLNGEIIVGSYSKAVYFIDGISGKLNRVFNLPESEQGIVGGHNLMAFDIDGDGRNEILFGTEGPPISLYCLNLDNKDISIKWILPLKGSFICGGLSAVRLPSGECRIVAGTRKYIKGDGYLYLIGENGDVYWEIDDQDICSNRPTISDINNDGELEIIYGNCKYQGVKHGGHAVVRKLDDGRLIFATDLKDNTGSNQMKAVDLIGDSKKEIIAISNHETDKVFPAYNGISFLRSNGEIFWQVDEYNTNVISIYNKIHTLIIGSNDKVKELVVLNPKKRKILYKVDNIHLVRNSQALDIDNDGDYEILTTDGTNVIIIDLNTGKVEKKLRIPLNLKGMEFGRIAAMSVADCDNDSFLEIIYATWKGFIICFDTPGKCIKGLEFLHL